MSGSKIITSVQLDSEGTNHAQWYKSIIKGITIKWTRIAGMISSDTRPKRDTDENYTTNEAVLEAQWFTGKELDAKIKTNAYNRQELEKEEKQFCGALTETLTAPAQFVAESYLPFKKAYEQYDALQMLQAIWDIFVSEVAVERETEALKKLLDIKVKTLEDLITEKLGTYEEWIHYAKGKKHYTDTIEMVTRAFLKSLPKDFQLFKQQVFFVFMLPGLWGKAVPLADALGAA